MALSEAELNEVDASLGDFCRRLMQLGSSHDVEYSYKVDADTVTMWEARPLWQRPGERVQTAIARFRYWKSRGVWQLYWMPSDMKWHAYDAPDSVSEHIAPLIRIVEEDALGTFFG